MRHVTPCHAISPGQQIYGGVLKEALKKSKHLHIARKNTTVLTTTGSRMRHAAMSFKRLSLSILSGMPHRRTLRTGSPRTGDFMANCTKTDARHTPGGEFIFL